MRKTTLFVFAELRVVIFLGVGAVRFMLKDDIKHFEDGFLDGVYAIPRDKSERRVKVRALYDYCKERGITPSQLSEDEMGKFLEDKQI